jgi:hypothetical protein
LGLAVLPLDPFPQVDLGDQSAGWCSLSRPAWC